MSSFEIQGTVVKTENLTSNKGNAYISFQVKDAAGKIFEMSLVGDGMSHAEKLKTKGPVIVKGVLGSREYQDKNGKTRYGLELKPSWIEAASKTREASVKEVSADDFGMDVPF